MEKILQMKVYKYKKTNRYYIYYKATKYRVYYIEWIEDEEILRYGDTTIELFIIFSKYLEPVSQSEEIRILRKILEKILLEEKDVNGKISSENFRRNYFA